MKNSPSQYYEDQFDSYSSVIIAKHELNCIFAIGAFVDEKCRIRFTRAGVNVDDTTTTAEIWDTKHRIWMDVIEYTLKGGFF